MGKNKSEKFIRNFDLTILDNINEKIMQFQSEYILTQDELDSINLASAEESFSKCATSKPSTTTPNPPSWFGKKCAKARKQFHSAPFQYKLKKIIQNKEHLKIASKAYKSTVRLFFKKYKKDPVKKFKPLKP